MVEILEREKEEIIFCIISICVDTGWGEHEEHKEKDNAYLIEATKNLKICLAAPLIREKIIIEKPDLNPNSYSPRHFWKLDGKSDLMFRVLEAVFRNDGLNRKLVDLMIDTLQLYLHVEPDQTYLGDTLKNSIKSLNEKTLYNILLFFKYEKASERALTLKRKKETSRNPTLHPQESSRFFGSGGRKKDGSPFDGNSSCTNTTGTKEAKFCEDIVFPETSYSDVKVALAYEVLGISPSTPDESLGLMAKALKLAYHPDKGGQTYGEEECNRACQNIDNAVEYLLKFKEEKKASLRPAR